MQRHIGNFQVTRAQTALGVAQRLVQHRLFFAPKEEAGNPGQRKQIGRKGAWKFRTQRYCDENPSFAFSPARAGSCLQEVGLVFFGAQETNNDLQDG